MSGEIHQRLDNIRTILSSFRQEQEQLILKSADDQRFRSSKSSIAPPIIPSDAANEEVYLSRILNVESIVMPVGNSANAGQKLWPQAILSGRYGDIARMGNIESNGSLWRIVPRKDGAKGTRVVLQSAEIGEEPLYLNPSLQLVQNKCKVHVVSHAFFVKFSTDSTLFQRMLLSGTSVLLLSLSTSSSRQVPTIFPRSIRKILRKESTSCSN